MSNLPKTILIHEALSSGLLTKAALVHASQHYTGGADPITPANIDAEPELGTIGSAGTYGVEETVLGVHGLKALVEADITDLQDYALANNVLALDNTTPFTPDADYEPATKKYVDDNGGGLTQPQIMARTLGC